ncbi:MAG: hypothetical protein WAW97_09775, partial [Gemmiger qucibialis]
MEGFLPDGVMEVFGYAALSLLDDVGNRRGAHCAPLRPGNSAAIGWVLSKINALCPALFQPKVFKQVVEMRVI